MPVFVVVVVAVFFEALMGLCNILATKLAYPEEMILCYKFRPGDDPFSGLLNSSKKKQHLICYRREPTKAG